MPSTVVGKDASQRPRNAAGRRLEPGELGDAADELLLGHELAVGQVEDFADGRRAFGGEEDPFDQVFDIDTIERLLAGPEVGEEAALEAVRAAWARRCGRARRR